MNLSSITLRKKICIVLIAGFVLILGDFLIQSAGSGNVYRDAKGNVLLLRPDEGASAEHVYLKANVRGGKDGKDTYEKHFEISVDPYSKDQEKETDSKAEEQEPSVMEFDEVVSYELRSAVSEINDDISARKVTLPSTLPSGAKIYWSTEKKTNTFPIIILTVLTCIWLYRSKYSLQKRIQKIRKQSIIQELPEFVNKLVLLLNAGLVLNTAFEITVEESLASQEKETNYFTGKMQSIYTNMKQMNSPLQTEFRAFAKESGDNGVMRISNILSDNISKGVELTEKLQRESEVLWINRKRDCEERGRISETKLTVPLTLFLLVLVVITVSPALLEL